MKISILQCDVATGDMQNNLLIIEKAARNDGDISIIPLEAFTGPQTGPLSGIYVQDIPEALAQLSRKLSTAPPLLIGSPRLGNYLLNNGETLKISNEFFFNGNNICILQNSGCDDDADIAVNLDIYDFNSSLALKYENIMNHLAFSGKIALSANLVGGYGPEIYAGQSYAIFPDGFIRRAPSFMENIFIVNTDNPKKTPDYPLPDFNSAQWQALVLGVRDFVHKNGNGKALLGISGGMDSALVACIATEALGSENVLGVLMPSQYTSQDSSDDAGELAQNLGIKTVTIPIEPLYHAFDHSLAKILANFPVSPANTTMENLQARIRGVILMALANQSGALVLNTGNKSESAMGYSTLYGDSVGALAVIGDLFKTRVYELGKWYCGHKGKMIIPENIFKKAPSAELRPGQKDTDSLPPYEILDPQLAKISANPGVNKELRDLEKKVRSSRFKRLQSPPALLVSRSTDRFINCCC